jgi:OTT_1508-like deaminase
MGATYRAAKVLAHAAFEQHALFHDFEIQPIPCERPINGPEVDRQLTLKGIANRMVSNDKMQLGLLLTALHKLDYTMGLYDKVLGIYRSDTFRPRVHAELAVLEAVYAADIQFFDDDRYIACSKPACFCCYHYISNHPGRFIRPSSHNKVWPNWRPPALDQPEEYGSQKRRQDIMNKLTEEVRAAALDRVLKRSGARRRRPDSTTGIATTDMHSIHVGLIEAEEAAQRQGTTAVNQHSRTIHEQDRAGIYPTLPRGGIAGTIHRSVGLSRHSTSPRTEEEDWSVVEVEASDEDAEDGGVSLIASGFSETSVSEGTD